MDGLMNFWWTILGQNLLLLISVFNYSNIPSPLHLIECRFSHLFRNLDRASVKISPADLQMEGETTLTQVDNHAERLTKQQIQWFATNKCSDRSVGSVTSLAFQEIMTDRLTNLPTYKRTSGLMGKLYFQ